MDVEVDRLVPGMVLKDDVLGKSGNPIVEKSTVLTETHIEFIKRFLLDKVAVDPLMNQPSDKRKNVRVESVLPEQLAFRKKVSHTAGEYEKLFMAWQNNVPINMYDIREMFIPLFEQVVQQPIDQILSLLPTSNLSEKSCVISVLSVYLADRLGYEKKDWLQIGLAALLSDCGKAKLEQAVLETKTPLEEWRLYPMHSYKMIENETTLTSNAKLAIVQHQEYLDGSGFPAKSTGDQIKPYARIIAACEFFCSVYSDNIEETINLLQKNKNKKLDSVVVDALLNVLSRLSFE